MKRVGDDRRSALVSVVTPVLNGQELIAGTIRSVLAQTAVQTGRAHLEYVVADGGSNDDTVQVAREAGEGHIRVTSAADRGLYDALATVWTSQSTIPDVMAYLNAGDLWDPNALDIVMDVMADHGASWVCGMQVLYNHAGQMTHAWLPSRFRPRLITSGMYGGVLPHIQQESTFWSGELFQEVDLERLRDFRLAGDQFLWSSFAEREEPFIVEAVLGGHRVHQGQLSHDADGYRREALAATRPADSRDRLLAQWEWIVWNFPPAAKKRLNPRRLLRYDYEARKWR